MKFTKNVEGEITKTIFFSLISSLALITVLYYIVLKNVDGFVPKYGFYLLLAILSYAMIIASTKKVKTCGNFACMPGMMIGMTIGMISGFLPGFFVGATNGMFWGSLLGMSIGITFGVLNGKCCGIMGILEGIMAGFMGGLMGAMTAVMMINDNVKIAGVIVFAISSVTIIGLSYMINQEIKGMEIKSKGDQFSNLFLSLTLTAITTWLMVFGPRSALFQ